MARSVVPAVLAATSVEEKNQLLCNGIYNFFSSSYGTRAKGKRRTIKKSKQSNTLQNSLMKLRKKRNNLRNELRHAKKLGLSADSIRSLASKFHLLLRQYAQTNRSLCKSVSKNKVEYDRKECAKHFNTFAAKVLDGDDNLLSAEPGFDAATAESYFREVYHSEPRVFQKPQWLQDAPPPRVPFNDSLFVQGELDIAIKKTKSSSSPGPHDQVPYLVFKRCPSLTKALLDLFNICWRLQSVPSLWNMGVIRLIPKSAASQDPHLPSDFRPIALTSCVGKLFTTLMKNRWLQFMVANNYLNSSVHKAFLPGIPGCLEQYQKLLLMIADAHKKHRSLSVCWLDIANAYGSIHHQLITYCLQHYHAPSIFLNTVSNIYSDLSAIKTGPTWSTTSVPLRTGVYQGDPLSVVIFNTVMSTLADSLRAHQHLRYTLSGGNASTNLLLYADDTCLIADGPASCQHLLLQVEKWLRWTGLSMKIPKCFYLNLQASTAKRTPIQLILQDQVIPPVGEAFKFLGGPISVPSRRKQFR